MRIGNTRTAAAVGVIGLACMAAGCRGSSATSGSQASPTPSVQATPSPSPTPTATPPPAESPKPADRTATPVDVEALVALIPDIPGWVRAAPRGTQSTAGIPLSAASAEYTRDDATIKLEIMDSGFNRLILAPLSMMLAPGFAERTRDGYNRFARIGTAPGFEAWRDDLSEGSVTAVIADRFVVTGRGLDVPHIDVIRAAVQAVDFGRLAALK